MSDYGLKTTNDFNGPLADLIKLTNAYSKIGKYIINVLRIPYPDRKEVLKKINQLHGKTQDQKEIEEAKKREERASDFGIGEH